MSSPQKHIHHILTRLKTTCKNLPSTHNNNINNNIDNKNNLNNSSWILIIRARNIKRTQSSEDNCKCRFKLVRSRTQFAGKNKSFLNQIKTKNKQTNLILTLYRMSLFVDRRRWKHFVGSVSPSLSELSSCWEAIPSFQSLKLFPLLSSKMEANYLHVRLLFFSGVSIKCLPINCKNRGSIQPDLWKWKPTGTTTVAGLDKTLVSSIARWMNFRNAGEKR